MSNGDKKIGTAEELGLNTSQAIPRDTGQPKIGTAEELGLSGDPTFAIDPALRTIESETRGIGAVDPRQLEKLVQTGQIQKLSPPKPPTEIPSALYAPLAGFTSGAGGETVKELVSEVRSRMEGEERTPEQIKALMEMQREEAKKEHPVSYRGAEFLGYAANPLLRLLGPLGWKGLAGYGAIEGYFGSEDEEIQGKALDGLVGGIIGGVIGKLFEKGGELLNKSALLKRFAEAKYVKAFEGKRKQMLDYLRKKFKGKAEKIAVARLEPTAGEYKKLVKMSKTKVRADGTEDVTSKVKELGRELIDEDIFKVSKMTSVRTSPEAEQIMQNLQRKIKFWGAETEKLINKHDMPLFTKKQLIEKVEKTLISTYGKAPEYSAKEIKRIKYLLDILKSSDLKTVKGKITIKTLNDFKKVVGKKVFDATGKIKTGKEVDADMWFKLRDTISQIILNKRGTSELAKAWTKYHMLKTSEGYVDNYFSRITSQEARRWAQIFSAGEITGLVASGVLYQYHPKTAIAAAGILGLSSLRRRFGKNLSLRFNEEMRKRLTSQVELGLVNRLSKLITKDPKAFGYLHKFMMRNYEGYKNAYKALIGENLEKKEKPTKTEPYKEVAPEREKAETNETF